MTIGDKSSCKTSTFVEKSMSDHNLMVLLQITILYFSFFQM